MLCVLAASGESLLVRPEGRLAPGAANPAPGYPFDLRGRSALSIRQWIEEPPTSGGRPIAFRPSARRSESGGIGDWLRATATQTFANQGQFQMTPGAPRRSPQHVARGVLPHRTISGTIGRDVCSRWSAVAPDPARLTTQNARAWRGAGGLARVIVRKMHPRLAPLLCDVSSLAGWSAR
jgi:hypothetical protein